jgi:hypothetical protein
LNRIEDNDVTPAWSIEKIGGLVDKYPLSFHDSGSHRCLMDHILE